MDCLSSRIRRHLVILTHPRPYRNNPRHAAKLSLGIALNYSGYALPWLCLRALQPQNALKQRGKLAPVCIPNQKGGQGTRRQRSKKNPEKGWQGTDCLGGEAPADPAHHLPAAGSQQVQHLQKRLIPMLCTAHISWRYHSL